MDVRCLNLNSEDQRTLKSKYFSKLITKFKGQRVLFFLPKPAARRSLHRSWVQILMAVVGNLIIMNLQMARQRVNQMETVWIIMLKLIWNSRNTAQPREN